ncbi:MAG: gliding motility-associated C-terminal domain-containing protein, partial [Bacteroidales bacterium]
NPFNEFTSFSFNLPANCKNAQLNIYDLFGNLKRVFDIVGNKSQVWNGKDTNGKRVKTGIYLYNIYYDNCSTQINKLILTH